MLTESGCCCFATTATTANAINAKTPMTLTIWADCNRVLVRTASCTAMGTCEWQIYCWY